MMLFLEYLILEGMSLNVSLVGYVMHDGRIFKNFFLKTNIFSVLD